ncbi:MAG: VanZ family protein [Clostridia bacterium]|nr:VanZ family protein [Clostridia bacterium]
MNFKNLVKKILPYFYLLVYLLTTVLIIIKSAETGDVSASQSSNFANYLKENIVGMDKIAEKSEDFPTLVRKFFGHYGLFALNGVFAILTAVSFIKLRFLSIIIAFISGVAIASSSEIIQGFTDGRTLSITDAILNVQGNVSGIAVGLILTLFFKDNSTLLPLENLKNYLLFLSLSIISILEFFIFSEKYESIEFCKFVDVIVIAIWLIVEGAYQIFKFKNLKSRTN